MDDYDKNTERLAEEFGGRYFAGTYMGTKATSARCFSEGRSSAKESLAMACRAMEDAENDLAVVHDTIQHCVENSCVPTKDELKNTLESLRSMREAIAAITSRGDWIGEE